MPDEKKTTTNDKIAFVISPIGERDSTTRKRADQILNYIIQPVVSKQGYITTRADMISKPGMITSQIIDHLLNDPLVIADLTGHDPNVFYELAVRHAVRKPVIQMIQEGERIPFDISTTRTIPFNHQDLDSVDKAKRELERQIKAVEKDPTLADSPVSVSIDLKTLKQPVSDFKLQKKETQVETGLNPIELKKVAEQKPSEFITSEIWEKMSEIEKSDISDAAKCLLMGTATPSVMVALRGAEASLRTYYSRKTGINPSEKTWRQLTKELKEKAGNLGLKDAFIGYLDYIGDTKRNFAQHPNMIYSLREAVMIFMQVLTFVEDIYREI